MFIVANLVGSTIQITTLPLPVLSTLQAVCRSQSLCISAKLTLAVRPRLQLNMRLPHSQRALHALLFCRHRPRRRRRPSHWHIRCHSRALAQSKPAPEAPWSTPVSNMDGGHPDRRGHFARRKLVLETAAPTAHASNPPNSRNLFRLHQRYTVSTLPSHCQERRRAPGPHHRRPA